MSQNRHFAIFHVAFGFKRFSQLSFVSIRSTDFQFNEVTSHLTGSIAM